MPNKCYMIFYSLCLSNLLNIDCLYLFSFTIFVDVKCVDMNKYSNVFFVSNLQYVLLIIIFIITSERSERVLISLNEHDDFNKI